MYKGGTNPRDDLGDGILNVSTAEPPHITIPFHNEMSYNNVVPSRICFCCFLVCQNGGITLLMDNVKMTKNLPQYIKDKCQRYGVHQQMTMQNLEAYKAGLEPKWYNTWQDQFKVDTKEQMEEILKKMPDVEYEWLENDRLRYIQKTSGLISYAPDDGEVYQLH